MKSYDAIVVGGGVIGCSIAYELSKLHKKVAVFDKGEIGREASSAAGGLLGVQAEWDADDPLFSLAQKSRELFPILAEEIREISAVDIGYEKRGIYRIAHNEVENERIQSIMAWQSERGERCEYLNTTELLQKEPYLSPTLIGGVFCKDDGHVLAPKLTEGLALSASYLGVDFYPYSEVIEIEKMDSCITGVQTTRGLFHTPQVVIATGAFSNHLLEPFQTAVFPVKGEVIRLHHYEQLLQSPIFCERFYIAPKRGGHYIIGSTMMSNDYSKNVTAEGFFSIVSRAFELVPKLREATVKDHWAGLRPQSTANRPIMEEHPSIKGLYAAIGHYRNGILLSAITGKIMAEKMKGGT